MSQSDSESLTVMRDCAEKCPVCAAKTCELVRVDTGERLHLYCKNADCERSRWL